MMQSWGKDDGVATPGASFMPPWRRIAYVVTQQSCTYEAPITGCPTSDNVRVNIDTTLVFRIRNPDQFVYKLGATHFDILLAGSVEEAIRLLVRKQSHRTVRSLRGSTTEGVLRDLNEKFDAVGVIFLSCTVREVELPASLAKSLERAAEMEKALVKTKREHEYQVGEIERKRDIDIEELNRRNEQTLVAESGKKKRAELNHEQRMVKEQELTQTAMIEAETNAQVTRMEIAAELERTKIDMERLRVESISKAEADAEARRVQADIEFERSQMNAEAERRRLIGDAEALRLDAEAEAAATQHLTHKRRHELNLQEKEVLSKLAEALTYNLLGDNGDRLVSSVITGHVQPPAMSGVKGSAWLQS